MGKLQTLMITWFGANWKPKLIGITSVLASIVLGIIQPMAQAGALDLSKIDWKTFGGALVVGILGMVAKANNVTGGTVASTKPGATTIHDLQNKAIEEGNRQ